MPDFRYQAVGTDGTVLSGESEGADPASVAAALQARGLLPLRVVAAGGGPIRRLLTRDILARDRPTQAAVADFLRRLATLLGGGIPLEAALAIAGGREGAPKTRCIVQELLCRLRDGSPLADAMASQGNVFPAIAISMTRAGESSGTLPGTLAKLAEYLQRSEEVRQSIRSALIYPAVLLVTACGSVVVVLAVVLPALEPMIEDSQAVLPPLTQAAFAASTLVRRDGWMLVLVMAIVFFVARRTLASPATKARRDALLLKIPVAGTAIRKSESARFARTLGSLIGGGVSLPSALALAHPVLSNRVLADAVARIATVVREGGGLSEPLSRARIFPDLGVQLIRIGEATGRLDAMLLELADIFEGDVKQIMNRALTLLVPVLTISLGALVAGLVASVMLAVLSVNDLVQ